MLLQQRGDSSGSTVRESSEPVSSLHLMLASYPALTSFFTHPNIRLVFSIYDESKISSYTRTGLFQSGSRPSSTIIDHFKLMHFPT